MDSIAAFFAERGDLGEPRRTADPSRQPAAATDCLIAFGSNLGDGPQLFAQSLDLLQREFGELRTSRLYRTRPIGPGIQSEYLNAAICMRTSQPAAGVLRRLLAIERVLGRERSERWTARTADLDLLLYGHAIVPPAGEESADAGLAVPHPRLSFRQFVLQPACEIAGDWLHPVCRATLNELRVILGERPNLIAVADPAIWRDIWESPPTGERHGVRNLPGGATVLRGLRDSDPSPTSSQYELVLVEDDASWRWLHSRAKLLLAPRPAERVLSSRVPRWRGPLLELPRRLGADELLREVGGALAAMSPEGVLGIWPDTDGD